MRFGFQPQISRRPWHELTDISGLFELTNNTKIRTVRIYVDTNLYRQGFRDLIAEAADLAAA